MHDDDTIELLECDEPAAPVPRSSFVYTDLSGPLAIEAALYGLRILSAGHWHARLLRNRRIRDEEILDLLGIAPADGRTTELDASDLREALERQMHRLDSMFSPDRGLVHRNVRKLATALRLTEAEERVLRFAIITSSVNGFSELLRAVVRTGSDLMSAIARATGLTVRVATEVLIARGSLTRCGFLQSWSFDPAWLLNPLAVDQSLLDTVLLPRFDEGRLLRHTVKKSPAPRLTLEDYSHLPDLSIVKRYLENASAQRRKGVNILLYGVPGTGKTEFVRALAAASGLDLFEVPTEDRSGEAISGERRFRAYALCQNLLGPRRRQMILFDEVEDVFSSGRDLLTLLFGTFPKADRSGLRKAWVNQTLEENPVPAFWLCNAIDMLDPAWIRRFDLVVHLDSPPRQVRRRIVNRYFRRGEISEELSARLSSHEALSPAQIERAARVSRALRSRNVSARDAEVERIVGGSMKAMGFDIARGSPILPTHYDTRFLNSDRDLDSLAEGLERGRHGARLLLFGPPGTGKTAFAHHLGDRLARPVTVKRGSDLISKWIGETEKGIAHAFQRAQDENSILVIDEADSFLRERTGHHQTWETTQVNELLTQMESFDGIFVASTNLVETLDAASLRRFDFKVKFGYLTLMQRRAMLRSLCPHDAAPSEADDVLGRLENVTPGDFANVMRQLHVTGEAPTPTRIVSLLDAECSLKPEARRRPIGFAAAR